MPFVAGSKFDTKFLNIDVVNVLHEIPRVDFINLEVVCMNFSAKLVDFSKVPRMTKKERQLMKDEEKKKTIEDMNRFFAVYDSMTGKRVDKIKAVVEEDISQTPSKSA